MSFKLNPEKRRAMGVDLGPIPVVVFPFETIGGEQ